MELTGEFNDPKIYMKINPKFASKSRRFPKKSNPEYRV